MAAPLPTIRDEEKESKFGFVYAVSGPGKLLAPNKRFPRLCTMFLRKTSEDAHGVGRRRLGSAYKRDPSISLNFSYRSLMYIYISPSCYGRKNVGLRYVRIGSRRIFRISRRDNSTRGRYGHNSGIFSTSNSRRETRH